MSIGWTTNMFCKKWDTWAAHCLHFAYCKFWELNERTAGIASVIPWFQEVPYARRQC
jgi:hypothetical protein